MKAIPSSPYTPTTSTVATTMTTMSQSEVQCNLLMLEGMGARSIKVNTIHSSSYSAIHRLEEQLLLWMVHLPLALCSPSPSLLLCPSLAPLLPPNTWDRAALGSWLVCRPAPAGEGAAGRGHHPLPPLHPLHPQGQGGDLVGGRAGQEPGEQLEAWAPMGQGQEGEPHPVGPNARHCFPLPLLSPSSPLISPSSRPASNPTPSIPPPAQLLLLLLLLLPIPLCCVYSSPCSPYCFYSSSPSLYSSSSPSSPPDSPPPLPSPPTYTRPPPQAQLIACKPAAAAPASPPATTAWPSWTRCTASSYSPSSCSSPSSLPPTGAQQAAAVHRAVHGPAAGAPHAGAQPAAGVPAHRQD